MAFAVDGPAAEQLRVEVVRRAAFVVGLVDLDVRAAGLVLAHGELARQAVLMTSVVDERLMMRRSDADLYAEAFVERYGTDVSKRLFDVAARISLTVKKVDVTSFDGALIRAKGADRGKVPLNRNVPEPGRRLFTLAHGTGFTTHACLVP